MEINDLTQSDGEPKIENTMPSASSYPAALGLNNDYVKAATSNNTRRAYRQDIRHFEASGGVLPATPDSICRYLTSFAKLLNPRTLQRRLVALKNWHNYQGFIDPTSHPAVQKTMMGIHRVHGKPKIKAHALSIEELTKIVIHLESIDDLAAKRDNALLQVGYFGALRRSELVAICYENISFQKEGIEILLPSSKTDQLHEGQYCAIPFGNNTLCPILALKTWLNHSAIKEGPIFRRIFIEDQLAPSALTPLSVNHILKTRAKKAGLSHYAALSGHSLRRGFATSAANACASLQSIMRGARWKHPNTAMEYIDARDRFLDHAAKTIFQKSDE